MAKDPVCGMDVKEGQFCSTHDGKKYCFCSKTCKEKFDQNPGKYAKGEEHKKHGCH